MRGSSLGASGLAIALTAGSLGFSAPLLAQQAVRPGHPVPLELAPRASLVWVPFGEEAAVVYELVVGNPSARTLVVDRLVASDGTDELAAWDGPELAGRSARLPRMAEGGRALLELEPGSRHILYLWIEVDKAGSPPTSVGHRAWIRDPETDARWTLSIPVAPVERVSLMIDPPVRGGRWLVRNGFANETDHRRFVTASGKLYIPQRFGADFLKLGMDGGNAAAGQPLRNEDFHAFDEPLYAVGDGTVVAVRSGLPDNVAGTDPGPLDWNALPGNHVVLGLDEGGFALYAHLRAGSIEVGTGQRVGRGQRIARIGNSGNTSAPHLHFHMMDGPDPNLAEGVPFVFAEFERLAVDYRFDVGQLRERGQGVLHEASVPRLDWVIGFPEGGSK